MPCKSIDEICPVCLKGELLDSAPFTGPVKMPVSHFNCVLSLKHILWMTQNEAELLNEQLTKAENRPDRGGV
jgi:hypothetical protein